jgi:hypothetical protein
LNDHAYEDGLSEMMNAWERLEVRGQTAGSLDDYLNIDEELDISEADDNIDHTEQAIEWSFLKNFNHMKKLRLDQVGIALYSKAKMKTRQNLLQKAHLRLEELLTSSLLLNFNRFLVLLRGEVFGQEKIRRRMNIIFESLPNSCFCLKLVVLMMC